MQLIFSFCGKELCVLNGKEGALGPAKETKMYVEIKKVLTIIIFQLPILSEWNDLQPCLL